MWFFFQNKLTGHLGLFLCWCTHFGEAAKFPAMFAFKWSGWQHLPRGRHSRGARAWPLWFHKLEAGDVQKGCKSFVSAALAIFVGIILLSNVLTLGFCCLGEEALVCLWWVSYRSQTEWSESATHLTAAQVTMQLLKRLLVNITSAQPGPPPL